MSDLANITWRLDAYAGHWLTDSELAAVTEWMAENDLDRATAERPVLVENGTVTYGQDRSGATVRAPHREIVTTTKPLRTAPPQVRQLDCTPPARAALESVFSHHEWSCGFGGVCVTCSRITTDEAGRVWCHQDDAVTWPCRPVWEAMLAAGCPVPTPPDDEFPGVVFGDCLDPEVSARAFAGISR